MEWVRVGDHHTWLGIAVIVVVTPFSIPEPLINPHGKAISHLFELTWAAIILTCKMLDLLEI